MTSAQKIYLYIFFIFAIAYIGALPFQPYPGNFVIKEIPDIALAILALTAVIGLRGKLLFVAVLFCAAGGVALELEAGKYFMFGLVFFLLAHVMYIVTFSRDLKVQKSRIPAVVLLVIYGLIMAFVLRPSLGEMALPVYFYLVVITTMGIFAALRASKSKLVLYGAISFIVSDSILAINKFLVPVLASDYLVMITYYLAQFLIVYGFVKSD